jgi:hypothetical protein
MRLSGGVGAGGGVGRGFSPSSREGGKLAAALTEGDWGGCGVPPGGELRGGEGGWNRASQRASAIASASGSSPACRSNPTNSVKGFTLTGSARRLGSADRLKQLFDQVFLIWVTELLVTAQD